jgi:hypothetical protein
VVRTTLDRMIDRNESLLDNPDFQRGRKLMPERFDTISYADTRATVQFIYPWLIPVAQTLIALGQGEGFEVDPTMLPSLACVMRHTFGEVSAGGLTDEGYLTVWHGSFPVNVGASAGPIAVGAVVAGIMAPSVARGRELSKRSVSISNLKEIGLASYLYAEKHNNRLPPNLQVLLDSELIEESVLRSPLADDDTAESYVYLGGNLQGEVADRIMAYEKPEHYDGEGTLVLFLDAHVEFVPLDQFEELLEETKKALDREPGQDAEPADEPTQPDDGGAELDPEEQLAIAQLLVRRGGPVATALEAYRKDVGTRALEGAVP